MLSSSAPCGKGTNLSFADEGTGRLDPAAQAEPQTAECHSGEEGEGEGNGGGGRDDMEEGIEDREDW